MSMKMYKQITSLVAPDVASEGMLAQANAGTQGVIVVGFNDIDVYGKKNGAWELIKSLGDADPATKGAERVVISLEEYEDMYFVSKTGKEETMRYFFVEDTVVAPITEQTKINSIADVNDVPSFTAADAGKVLSVDAQGNLAWINR